MSTAISSMTIFELVRPFAEADDPKLRGNAVHAYAALLESPEENVRRQARDELLASVWARGSWRIRRKASPWGP